LGPKFGADFPKAKKELAELDPNDVVSLVNNGDKITSDSGFVFNPEEIIIRTEPAEGLSTGDSNLLTVGITTEITPELMEEGLAREIIRRIQDARKQADFEISDRISLVYKASPGLTSAMTKHREYIMAEVLALEMEEGDPRSGMFSSSTSFEGEEATLGLEVVSK
jgi:isoleucyl-tRNA synthetase